jgi:hypothetical protein
LAWSETGEVAGLLEGGEGEVVVVVLAGYSATVNLVGIVVVRVERAVGFEGECEWVVGCVDFDDRPGSAGFDGVWIGVGGVGAAAEDYRFGEELNTEAG